MMIKYFLALIFCLLLGHGPAKCQESDSKIPNFIGSFGIANAGANPSVPALRFLTVLESAPWSFLDQTGKLSGFNVFLAKSICGELKIQSGCTIEAMPNEELTKAITEGRGDAIIGGRYIQEASSNELSFSLNYLRFPSRFVVSKKSTTPFDFNGGLAFKKIGVLTGSAHERLARSFFPRATVIGFTASDFLTADLNNQKIDLIFGDGLNLAFFTNGQASQDCCRFEGGAYYSDQHLGDGMRIAVSNTRPDLVEAINAALVSIQVKGGIDEQFLRFFPYNFY